jgi:hypothetical protein
MRTLVRRHLPSWRIRASGIEFFRAWQVPVTRYRYEEPASLHLGRALWHDHVKSRMLRNGHVRFGGRAAETTSRKTCMALLPYTYVATWA